MATQPGEVRYNFEYARKVRVAFIGAGGHAFRNVYPTFQYAPVDLVAVCDLDGDRAAAFARQFGATASYTDHRAMLARERLDAVFIVTSYGADGRPQATGLALDALEAGLPRLDGEADRRQRRRGPGTDGGQRPRRALRDDGAQEDLLPVDRQGEGAHRVGRVRPGRLDGHPLSRSRCRPAPSAAT